MSFEISNQKGFQITYKNGYTVSVQFGGGNYCTNRDLPIEDYGKLCRQVIQQKLL